MQVRKSCEKNAQFVRQHAKTQGGSAGPLGKKNGIERHDIDLDRDADHALDLFIDMHNLQQVCTRWQRLGGHN